MLDVDKAITRPTLIEVAEAIDAVNRNLIRWAGALIIAGILLTFVGTELHIV